eukprot:1160071-Pelagomonas_calceolata.AAC.15
MRYAMNATSLKYTPSLRMRTHLQDCPAQGIAWPAALSLLKERVQAITATLHTLDPSEQLGVKTLTPRMCLRLQSFSGLWAQIAPLLAVAAVQG